MQNLDVKVLPFTQVISRLCLVEIAAVARNERRNRRGRIFQKPTLDEELIHNNRERGF